MVKQVLKTIPSEDILLSWLGGILDGEGSLGLYNTNKNSKRKRPRITIVNSDLLILNKVKEILNKYNIIYSFAPKPKILERKQCYYISIDNRDSAKTFLEIIEPFIIGGKNKISNKIIKYINNNPRMVNQYSNISRVTTK